MPPTIFKYRLTVLMVLRLKVLMMTRMRRRTGGRPHGGANGSSRAGSGPGPWHS